jgi:hypothetical protein
MLAPQRERMSGFWLVEATANFWNWSRVGLARRRVCVERAKEALGGASAVSSTPSLRANAQTISETQDMLLSKSEPL